MEKAIQTNLALYKKNKIKSTKAHYNNLLFIHNIWYLFIFKTPCDFCLESCYINKVLLMMDCTLFGNNSCLSYHYSIKKYLNVFIDPRIAN